MNDEALGLTKYLYGDDIGRVQLVQHWGTDATVVRSARVSFGKDSDKEELSEGDVKLVEYLVKNKHTSTLEHCGITFKFVVPLYVRSQHHRHRTWSYNEISRRYTDFNLEFYEPKQFRKQSKSNRQASVDEWFNPEFEVAGHPVSASDLLNQQHDNALYVYNKLLGMGICREQARGVLPQNLYTEYYGTCNLSNLLKFIDLRMQEGSQWEIQVVAEACLDFAKSLFPVTVESYLKTKQNI